MNKNGVIFFPGLNGLRAIAALAVVASHTTVYLDFFNLNPHLIGSLPNGTPKGIDLSDFAVSIFFALSGFLITYLLLEEDRTAGSINVRHFYVRRILRIWPLYYAYYFLAVLVILIWRLDDDYSVPFYLFFMANVPKVMQLKSDMLGHYWSLGVEEQFYLVWPWIVIAGRRHLDKVIPVLFAGFIGLKALGHFGFPGSVFETAMYINRFDCMLIGAMGAVLYFQQSEWFIRLVSRGWMQALGWLSIFMAAVNSFHIANIIDHEILSGFTVVLIIGQIRARYKIIKLDNRVFDTLGKISYGIYVIHPLAIFLLSRLLPPFPDPTLFWPYLLVYTGVMGGTILWAWLSYQYMEKWFLKRKLRFSTVRSTDTKP